MGLRLLGDLGLMIGWQEGQVKNCVAQITKGRAALTAKERAMQLPPVVVSSSIRGGQ